MGENHDQDEGASQEGLSILIHIEKYEGGPVYSTFLQKEIVGEIIKWLCPRVPSVNWQSEWVWMCSDNAKRDGC